MERILAAPWFRNLSMFMAALMLVIGFVPRVDAGFVPTVQSNTFQTREADMAAVQKALENKVVAQRLADFGYNPQEVQQRLKLVSNDELHKLATQIQSLDTAGDGLGIVIAVLVIVVLVLLILHLTNRTVTVK
ncbi:hypothetical protein dsx2_2136 [Desulfovibrio sp. X2]|uniref:PA2779 family protein n=1 Tax=Desulfovibrio sp. X2 TaxID=941449 RepID=UPI000358D344|nr:PA2779 family protein [Desulfovibrio sp. X2]EPR43709.1 hypothetical protein dsx2_2136 [Desulfovibrio sp. X2]